MITQYSLTIKKDNANYVLDGIARLSLKYGISQDVLPVWYTNHAIDILVEDYRETPGTRKIINLKIDSRLWPRKWRPENLLALSGELLDAISEIDHSRILSISSEIVT